MPWYKNIWFYAAILIAAILVFSQIRGCKQQQHHITYQTQLQDSIKHYRDKQGHIHATKQVVQIPQNLYKRIADSVVQSLAKNTKAKNLVQHSEITTATKHRDTVPYYDTQIIYTHTGDTVTGKYFVFNDNALSLSGLLFDGKVDINYNMQIHLKHTTKWQRNGWFGKKKLIVDVCSTTPYTMVTGLQSYVIQPPPKKWYETDFFKYSLGIGLGMVIHNNVK